jgi:enoyl-CoA hydratase
MFEDIVFEQKGSIGLITLNRPQALNALTFPMILALEQQLNAWKIDDDIHAVVIKATPGKAFCAGGDVRSLYDERATPEQQMQFFWHEYRLNHLIHHFEKPYIALMDGVTMGGGVGISLHGSHPVATERFLFAMPETGIGFFPDIGASYLLSRCPGRFGVYLGLTGNRLSAVDALAVGLVRQVVPSTRLDEVLSTLIDTDLSNDAPLRVSDCIDCFALPLEAAPILAQRPLIDHCFGPLDVESILNKLAESNDAWHHETLKTLEQKSPLSLKITLEQLHRAQSMSMAECVQMDYCLVGHFMRAHDFYEGVRALLVDKDKSPCWQPDSLSHVTNAIVADYFECGQPELPLL